MCLVSLTHRGTGSYAERRRSSQSRHGSADFTSSPSSSQLCLLTAEDSDEKTLALPFYTQRQCCWRSFTRSLHGTVNKVKASHNEHRTKHNSSHTFTEINKHFTFSCFSSPGSTSMCPNTQQKSWSCEWITLCFHTERSGIIRERNKSFSRVWWVVCLRF